MTPVVDLRSDVDGVLTRFVHTDPGQIDLALEYRDFVQSRVDSVWRSCAIGHVTASALVVDGTSGAVLLTLHPRVGRWLQLGGHLEIDDASLMAAALREVEEESGIAQGAVSSLPIRLDRHPVLCGRNEDGTVNASVHWDVQYLVRVDGTPSPRISSESEDLRWFTPDGLPDIDGSVRSLVDDARTALGGATTWITFG